MKIKVHSEGHKFVIFIPNFLIKPSLIWMIIKDKLDEQNKKIVKPLLPVICKAIRHLNKRYKHFVFVDVLSANGDVVRITL